MIDPCNCVTLDREKLATRLASASGPTTSLIAETPCHLSRSELAAMQRVIDAVEHVCRNRHYREHALAGTPAIAAINTGPAGVLMGYDFHFLNDVPQLIEINTNAGGALINRSAIRARRYCCIAARLAFPHVSQSDYSFVQSFIADWRSCRDTKQPTSIAIVDTKPEQQFLYPEFVMFRDLFEAAGIRVVIADPSELVCDGKTLTHNGIAIDMVYNRTTDFYFEAAESRALASAWQSDCAVITPGPFVHAVYANKTNLVTLSDDGLLKSFGIDSQHREVLARSIPKTERVTADNLETLWNNRKQLVFKPVSSYASKAVYRGDKITRKIRRALLQQDYVAQALVPPPTLTTEDNRQMKFDIRNFSYRGTVQLVSARLYQGQVTNMRTPGGGYSPVLKDRLPRAGCCA